VLVQNSAERKKNKPSSNFQLPVQKKAAANAQGGKKPLQTAAEKSPATGLDK
jgi:hypothetical protein